MGSGQFGTVNKGEWQNSKGQQEVAVKQLSGASEEDTVKFLKEAAIMGQFSHPNIITLLGVVTVGEPVSVLLEISDVSIDSVCVFVLKGDDCNGVDAEWRFEEELDQDETNVS